MNKEILYKEGTTASLNNNIYEDITIECKSNNSFNFTLVAAGASANIQLNLYVAHSIAPIRIAVTVDTEQYAIIQFPHLSKGSYKMRLVNKSGAAVQVIYYRYQFTQS